MGTKELCCGKSLKADILKFERVGEYGIRRSGKYKIPDFAGAIFYSRDSDRGGRSADVFQKHIRREDTRRDESPIFYPGPPTSAQYGKGAQLPLFPLSLVPAIIPGHPFPHWSKAQLFVDGQFALVSRVASSRLNLK